MSASGVAPIDGAVGGLEPGLPLVLDGATGSGRTVLCLELAAAALARGECVAYLGAEPPALLLRQAASLGHDLAAPLRSERFVLLELDPGAATSAQIHGATPLVEALRDAAPAAQLWIVDPLTALTREIFDERPLQKLVRELFEGLPQPGASLVATADRALLAEEPAAERALKNLCGAYLVLERDASRHSLLRVAKSRSASPHSGSVAFRIAAGGSRIVAADEGPAATRSATGGRARAKILIVEEERGVREEIQSWLAGRWDVVTADDGVSGLSRVLAERPDLILLDLHMSRIPGREVLLSMRQGGVAVPVLAVSDAEARSTDRVGALVLGASDVVTHPLKRFELVHRVESLLRLPVDPSVDPPEADRQLLAPLTARRSRSLPRELFEERLERAVRFGREYGLGSCVVFLETPSEADFDALVAAADDALRAEDGVLALSERRAAVLLVATEVAGAPHAIERIWQRYAARRGGRDGGLAWSVASAPETLEGDADSDWKSLCQNLEPWPPAEPA